MIFLAQVGSFHNVLCSIIVISKNSFDKEKDIIFFVINREELYKKWSIVDSFLKHLNINYKLIKVRPINYLEFNKSRINSIKELILNVTREIDFHITNFNDGLLYNIIRELYKKSKIFLIDDGAANTIYLKRKKKILKKIQSKILKIHFNFSSNYSLALKDDYNKFYTALNINHIKFIKNKCITINNETKNIYYKLIKFDRYHFQKIAPNSCLICTHHSVDTGRLSLKKYEKIIIKIKNYVKDNFHISNFYYVKHPAESDVTSHIYSSQNFIPLDKYNAEIYLHSNRIKYCIHPNNSIPIVAESIISTNVKYYNYQLPKAAHSDSRSELNSIFDSGKIN